MAVEWSSDTEAAGWIVKRLHAFGQDVGSVIPEGFAAQARVFHPATRWYRSKEVGVRWADIAAWAGRIVHPEMQFHRISSPASEPSGPQPWDREPNWGSLPELETSLLVENLAGFTATPQRCWFCLWDGYGWEHGGPAVGELTSQKGPGWSTLRRRRRGRRRTGVPGVVPPEVRSGPRVRAPSREYLLYRGPVTAALRFCGYPWDQSPNLWWPEDRSWCVATEIDLAWTYVGGSTELIETLLGDERLEALPARLEDHFTFESDRLNG